LGGDFVPFSRQTAYGQIADAIRADILAGVYEPSPDDPTRDQLPGAAELGSQYGVSDKTAARAVQQLISEGLVLGRPGLRPVVVPRAQRPDRWPMNRRYARAREARGLVFGTGLMAPGDFPPGGVVGVLEDAGHRVLRTYNEARARLATDEELRAFGADPSLQPLHGQVVIEIIHGTYGAEDEALEALVSIRPAAGNVIVFETYEGEHGEADQPAGISHATTAADV
jgi:DNA-binding transcriptional MocR family regulator